MASDPTRARIACARSVMRAHARATGLGGEDLATQLCDLIVDLLHLGRVEGADWRSVLAAAITHHASESIEPAEPPSGQEWQGAVVHALSAGLRHRRSRDSEHLTYGNVIPLFAPRRVHDSPPPGA